MNENPRFNRRQFLKTAALATAPFLLPASVRAAETAPSERLTLGFIGLGKHGRGLLNNFLKRPDTQVVAVSEVDWTRRQSAQKMVEDYYAKQTGKASWTGCDAYNECSELLNRRDIDAVVIATPDHWHALITIAAAWTGKDIYCEKPLCQSIREARGMVDTVRRKKRVFQTGSQQRSMPEFRTAVELIRNGVLGEIERIEVGVGGGPGIPCDLPGQAPEQGLDWNLWLGPAPMRPYNAILSPRGVHDNYPDWRKYREYGGGQVTDWGAHHFDIIQWALDMDESGPVEFIPATGRNAQSGARFIYANGVEATHVPGNTLTFFGSAGKLFVNRGKFELTIGDTKKAESPKDLEAVRKEFLGGDAKHVYTSTDHHTDWLECIRTRNRPVADVEIGARSVSVCHLVNLTYYHGQRLKWDPAREAFTDGTGNPKWLEVEYRDPWRLV